MPQLLEAVRATIAKGWCQHTLAKNSQGEPVHYGGPEAVKWCIVGAMCKNGLFGQSYVDLAQRIEEIVCTDILSWNNDRYTTQGDVLSVLDRIIKQEEKNV